MRDERRVVGNVMIRRKEGDGPHGRHGGQTEQAAEDRGSSAPILRLDHHASRRDIGKKGRIEAFVSTHDDDEDALRRSKCRDAPSRLLQERFSTEDGTELLGPVITEELPCQWPKPPTVAARENQCPPRLCAPHHHDALPTGRIRADSCTRHDGRLCPGSERYQPFAISSISSFDIVCKRESRLFTFRSETRSTKTDLFVFDPTR